MKACHKGPHLIEQMLTWFAQSVFGTHHAPQPLSRDQQPHHYHLDERFAGLDLALIILGQLSIANPCTAARRGLGCLRSCKRDAPSSSTAFGNSTTSSSARALPIKLA